jgi:ankyrin repeat protein
MSIRILVLTILFAVPACKKKDAAPPEAAPAPEAPAPVEPVADVKAPAETPPPPAPPPSPSADADPLLAAAESGDIEKVKSLLEGGTAIDAVNGQGMSALHAAAKEKKKEMVAFLLERGANVNHADSAGQTALSWSANGWAWEVVDLVLEKGADPKVGISCNALGEAVRHGKAELARTLLSKGCDPNRKYAGVSMLELAKNFDQPELMAILKEAGAKE